MTTPVNLSPGAKAYLSLYDNNTYGIALGRDIACELQNVGYVEWVPGNQWSGTIYAITAAGRAALAAAHAGGDLVGGAGHS